MGNRSTRQQHQIEELEMSLAMTERELMEMSARMKKIESMNQTLAKDSARLRVENGKINNAFLRLQISCFNQRIP